MPCGERLGLVAVRGDPTPGGVGPVGGELGLARLPVGALGVGHRPPPAVAVGVGLLAPPLRDLLLVLGVVEAVEHLFCHELFTSLEGVDRGENARDLSVDPFALLPQPLEVAVEGTPVVLLAAQHLRDGGDAESEVSQHEDPLQAHER